MSDVPISGLPSATAVSGSDLVPLVHSGTTVAATLYQISSGSVGAFNVKAYDAKGDGTTDDTTAIQNAINAAISSGGGEVLLPPGTYLVSGSNAGGSNNSLLISGSNIVLRGAGYDATIIKGSATIGNNHVLTVASLGGSGSPIANVVVADLTLDGSNCTQTPSNANALQVGSTNYFRAYRVKFANATAYGSFISGTLSTYLLSPIFEDCVFYNCGGAANFDSLGGGYIKAGIVRFCEFIQCHGNAHDWTWMDGCTIAFNHTSNPANAGHGSFSSDSGTVQTKWVYNHLETGAIIVGGNATASGQPYGNTIAYNTFEGAAIGVQVNANDTAGAYYPALRFDISHNKFKSPAGNAISLNDVNDSLISHNMAYEVASGYYFLGLYNNANASSGCLNNDIIGNVVRDPRTSGAMTSNVLNSTSTASQFANRYVGNDFQDLTAAGGANFTNPTTGDVFINNAHWMQPAPAVPAVPASGNGYLWTGPACIFSLVGGTSVTVTYYAKNQGGGVSVNPQAFVMRPGDAYTPFYTAAPTLAVMALS